MTHPTSISERGSHDRRVYPGNLSRWFEAQVLRAPEAIAIVGDGLRLTYREANERANQLAHHLRTVGVEREVLVGLHLQRSPEVVLGILAILKAGGAYVPIDPLYPTERVAYMLADAQPRVLITQQALAAVLGATDAVVVQIDAEAAKISTRPRTDLTEGPDAEDLAYVIYTSGSTGRPKGSLITHHNVVRLFRTTESLFHFGPADVWTLFHSYAFDFSVWEIWGPLLYGGTLVVVPYTASRSPDVFHRLLCTERVTVLNQTPSAFRLLMAAEEAAGRTDGLALRLVIFGGESLDFRALQRWFDRHGDECPQLVNMYGITETTVHVTYHPIRAAELGRGSVIGRPIPDLTVHLLNRDQQPVAPGEAGEIYVGGAGVGRGYLRQPELTAERFLVPPNGNLSGGRLYRSGDLARALPNGDIEYLGRIDDQVKLRGFRIELGEIESALSVHPSIRAAAAAITGEPPAQSIVAASTLRTGSSAPSAAELRTFLARTLPDYMIPARFAFLDELPLTINGKVDRKTVATIVSSAATPASEAEKSWQDGSIEQVIEQIWCGLLHVAHVGPEEDFFAIGGHSLLAGQILARIRERFGAELLWGQFYHAPTIVGVAAAVRGNQQKTGRFPVPLRPVADRTEFPLSSGQQRLWFIEQLEPGNRAYTSQCAIRFRGKVDLEIIGNVLSEIVRRHAMFRTTFHTRNGQACQVIHEHRPVNLPVHDLRNLPPGSRTAETRRLTHQEYRRPFDLATGPPVRWIACRISEVETMLLHHEHHLVHDGWSFRLFVGELMQLYAAFAHGQPSPLTTPEVHFGDFAVAEEKWLESPTAFEQQAFWKHQLQAGVPPLPLPYDRPRPAIQSFVGDTLRVDLPLPLCQSVRALHRREGVSLYALLLAAFQAFLHRCTSEPLISTGCSVANRKSREVEVMVGMFVNNVVIQSNFSAGPSFLELVRVTRDWSVGAQDNSDLPFDRVVTALGEKSALGFNPLYQVMFNFHDSPLLNAQWPGVALELEEVINNGSAKFDLGVTAVPHSPQLSALGSGRDPESIAFVWDYNTDLFERGTIERLAGCFQCLLTAAVANPSGNVSALPLLTEEGRRQVIEAWQGATAARPPDRCLHELIESQVDRFPSAPAVVAEAGVLTFHELDARANQLARHLRSRGVARDVLVGVFLERSLDMVVALVGILKAGGAYVPLDPDHPQERIAFVIADAGMSFVLTHERLIALLPATPALIIALDCDRTPIAAESDRRIDSGATLDNLAYAIYTSGSTGRPKGTLIPHRAIGTYLAWTLSAYPINGDDAVLQNTPLSFDPSVAEIFSALVSGARLVLPPPMRRPDPASLAGLIHRHRVTTLYTVPSMLRLLLDEPTFAACAPSLRRVTCGGEALTGDLVEAFYRKLSEARLINCYGPTEATIISTFWECRSGETTGPIPIGRPIDHARTYIVDAHLMPVPVGIAGELLIGGACLAHGYLRRPELTAEKFVRDPFLSDESARVYRTGDLVRFRADGCLEFLGRIDQQVKLHGLRIELGEIEATLQRHPDISHAAVTVHERAGDRMLVAYVVSRNGARPSSETLQAHLRNDLPGYMVPATIFLLERLPLSPNGKIDRRNLPAPDHGSMQLGRTFVAPRSATEKLVAGIWQEVLGLPQVGLHDDFFALGGHSLRALQVQTRLQHRLGRPIPLRQIFETSTLAALAQRIESLQATDISLKSSSGSVSLETEEL